VLGYWGTHVINGAIYALQYDVLRDFEPVALLPGQPLVIVARKTVPASDLMGLVAWLKSNPHRASQGTTGSGSISHVAGLFFQKQTATQYQFIPYRGAAPMMQDLVGGQIDIGLTTPVTALPQMQAGLIKAYAVMARSRLEMAPDIPTVDEAGLSGMYFSLWQGLWAPRGTPPDVIAKLNNAIVLALTDPVVRGRLAHQGFDIPAREQQSSEALRAHQMAEIEKWWPIVRAANIKVD
jgi:tripartite-type tricarboxylate transporter receptor subunit TctC